MISQDSREDYSHNLMMFSLVRDLALLVRIAAIDGFLVIVMKLLMRLVVSESVPATKHKSYMSLSKNVTW